MLCFVSVPKQLLNQIHLLADSCKKIRRMDCYYTKKVLTLHIIVVVFLMSNAHSLKREKLSILERKSRNKYVLLHKMLSISKRGFKNSLHVF